MKPTTRARLRLLPRQQTHGATLIEVMVSVFLLTFGVLGLMAAQIRSVAAVSEAESRTAVAQAAETLAEGMLANPTVHQDANQFAMRRYTNYTTGRNIPQSVDMAATNTLPPPLWGANWSHHAAQTQNDISKQALADNQIAMFEYLLRQTPNAQTIQYVVCEEANNPPRNLTVDANGTITDTHCSPPNSNGSAVVKVVWTTRTAQENSPTNVYTYLLQVQQ